MGGCGAPLRPGRSRRFCGCPHTQEEEPDGDFFARKQWQGVRPGFCFKRGDKGVGYYKDVPYHVAQAAAEKAALKLSAPTLANWLYELLQAPPSVKKADRFYELFQLDVLRVVGLGASHQTLTLTLTLSLSLSLSLSLRLSLSLSLSLSLTQTLSLRLRLTLTLTRFGSAEPAATQYGPPVWLAWQTTSLAGNTHSPNEAPVTGAEREGCGGNGVPTVGRA